MPRKRQHKRGITQATALMRSVSNFIYDMIILWFVRSVASIVLLITNDEKAEAISNDDSRVSCFSCL